jgi:hypothetical protein
MRRSFCWIAPVIAAIAGCANPGIVKISPDTYLIARQDRAGVFGNSARLKANVLREASVFAESLDKVAIPVSAKEIPMGRGPAQFASYEYQFRVVDPADPKVRRTSLVPGPDVVIEKSEKQSIDVTHRDTSSSTKDLYSELTKLDDLRKKGIISEQEFAVQKQKLLDSR